jgi:hypothetical protein
MKNIKKLQAVCDAFNARTKVGDEVMVKIDGRAEPMRTKTRSPAQVLSGHSPVVWLEGVSGCYLLTHVSALPNTEASNARERGHNEQKP